MLLVGFKDGVKCAEVPIDNMPNPELQTILEIWEKIGRTWSYEVEVKPFYWPRFEIAGKEAENDK